MSRSAVRIRAPAPALGVPIDLRVNRLLRYPHCGLCLIDLCGTMGTPTTLCWVVEISRLVLATPKVKCFCLIVV